MTLNVNVALCGDANVAAGIAAVIGSATVALHPRASLTVYIVDCGLGPERARSLQALENRLANTKVKMLALPVSRLADFPLPPGLKHLTLGAYARLFLHELLPEVERVLYLDADLLVRADLSRWENIALGEAALAAAATPDVPCFDHPSESLIQELPEIPGNTPYFNSGVMVLNLRRLRELSATRLYQAMAARISCRNGDQSILNAVFHGQWLPLPAHWNCIAPLHPSYRLYEDRRNAIWHFLGPNKPWQFAPSAHAGLLTLWHDQIKALDWKHLSASRLTVVPMTARDRARRTLSAVRRLVSSV